MTIRKILLFLAVCLSMGVFGYGILTTPDSAFIKMLRPPISSMNAKVIVGPFPLESDFRLLKSHGITTVISLLNPLLPYERQLLAQEEALARQYRLVFMNFPMTSILGQRFGADYERNAALAAKAAADAPGKVYLHCYLGLHRVKVVGELLAQYQLAPDRYLARAAERDAQIKLLDQAQAQFEHGDFAAATSSVDAMQSADVPALLLRAWSQYRLGNIANAQQQFAALAKLNPNNSDAIAGLGYSALRNNALDEAAEYFIAATKLDDTNPAVLAGMGIVKYRQGQMAQADEFLRRALQLDPNNDEARALLGKVAVGAGAAVSRR